MGATPFTRTAGAMLLATVPLVALGFAVSLMAVATFEPLMILALFAMVAVFVCTVTFMVGLLVRHRGRWWVRPFVVLSVLSFVALGWDRGVAEVIGVVSALLLAYGVVAARELPRSAAMLVAVGTVGDIVFDGTPLGTAASIVGVIGLYLLAWAMWREPVSGRLGVDVLSGKLPRDGERGWVAMPGATRL